MSSFGYDPSPLGRLLHFVTRTFGIGTFFGVHVRMYWAGAILVPLFSLQWVGGDGPMSVLGRSLVCSAALFLIIWTHEMGHIAGGWRYRIRTDLITLGPLGGLAHMNAPASSPAEELWITLAGPAVHLAWLAVFWPIKLLLSDEVLWQTWYGFTIMYVVAVNQVLLVFNLLPIFPLDGGRALRALLAMRVHANRATLWATNVGMIGGGVLVLLGLTRGGLQSSISVLIGLSCISSSLHERRMAQHVLVYQQRRDPWEGDGDAWKYAGLSIDDRRRRPGWLARWRADRAERRASARAEADAELERQVDAVLDRLHQVGMTGLSEREKAVLKRASQRRRGTG